MRCLALAQDCQPCSTGVKSTVAVTMPHEICCLCGFAYDLEQITSAATALVPQSVKDRASWSNDAFDNTQQQDAAEAFQLLMEACNTIDIERATELAGRNASENPVLLACARFGSQNNAIHSTPYHRIFTGLHRSILRCKRCGWQTTKYEPFDALQLPMRSDSCALHALMEDYCACEDLLDDNDRCCNADCGARQSRARVLNVVRWPRTFAITVKRFEVIRAGAEVRIEKNNAHMQFSRIFSILAPVLHRQIIVYEALSCILLQERQRIHMQGIMSLTCAVATTAGITATMRPCRAKYQCRKCLHAKRTCSSTIPECE